ncbi:MAG: hypothetical protein GYB31_17790 [Bacteroidetes bacterium]|nr:hypothetical protein [Bacteroidota bacterium]
MMKFFIKIFTIYIFALSLAPCGDGGGGIIVIANQLLGLEIQNSLDAEQNSDPCEDSPCSPFCICSSCFTAFDTAKEIHLPEKTPTLIPKTTPSFIPHFHPSSFNHSIWQPPKLG